MREPKIKNPKVFISYAWTSDEYMQRVVAFANELKDLGIEVLFDQFATKLGNDLDYFMEKSVNDPEVTNILILLNSEYVNKANSRKGGVGKETQIFTEEVYNKVEQSKVIPIIFDVPQNGEISVPTYLRSVRYVNLCNLANRDKELKLLIKSLYGEPFFREHDLGKMPSWVLEDEFISSQDSVKFEEMRHNQNSNNQIADLSDYLEEICNDIDKYDLNVKLADSRDADNYLRLYQGMLPIRNRFLELLKASVAVPNFEKQFGSFFETVYNRIKNNRTYTYYTELKDVLIHELFIYLISYCIKKELFGQCAYLLSKSYYIDRYESIKHYDIFRGDNCGSLDTAVSSRDQRPYISGTAMLWAENLCLNICSKEDFVLGDILCYNFGLFGNHSLSYATWFPRTYILVDHYDTPILRSFAAKLQSKEHLRKAMQFFCFDSEEDFKKRFIEITQKVNNNYYQREKYPRTYNSVPLLCDYIKSEDIGRYN